MEGYRSLESGDLRILEDGDSRVTEGFLDGYAVLSGAATISVTANLKAAGASPLASTGSELSAGLGKFVGRLNVSAAGSMAVTGQTRARGLFDVQAAGSLVPLGLKILHGSTALSGSGSFTSTAGFKFVGAFDKSASGSLVTAPRYLTKGFLGPFSDSSDRITENGDTRITENGDTRVTGEIQQNVGVSSIIVQPTYTVFSSVVYGKLQGNWKASTIYANVNGQWTIPEKVYQHINGGWKRIN